MALQDPHELQARQPQTTTTPASTPSPFLLFSPPPTVLTCTDMEISWLYGGPKEPMNVVITNVGVPQDRIPPISTTSTAQPQTSRVLIDVEARKRRAVPSDVSSLQPIGPNTPTLTSVPPSQSTHPSLTLTIVSDLDPFSVSYTWPLVSVPQGWYVFFAMVPTESFSALSNAFFVRQGNDSSCISGVTSTSVISTPVKSTTSTSSSPSSSSSGIILPVSEASSRPNRGAIVGISVGAVTIIAIALTAWFCLYRKSRQRPSSSALYRNGGRAGHYADEGRHANGAGKRVARTFGLNNIFSQDHLSQNHVWNGLASVDSRMSASVGGLTSRGSHTSSHTRYGSKHASRSKDNHGRSTGTVAMASEERLGLGNGVQDESKALEKDDKSSIGSPRSPSSPSAGGDLDMALAALPVLQHQAVASRTPQKSALVPQAVARAYSSPSNSNSNDSNSIELYASPNFKNQKRPSAPELTGLRSAQSVPPPIPESGSNSSRSQLELKVDLQSIKKLNRQSLPSPYKRKPVPAYDLDSDTTDSIPPMPVASPSTSSSLSSSVLNQSYMPTSRSSNPSPAPSFGEKNGQVANGNGKPMHYLIPDMPLGH